MLVKSCHLGIENLSSWIARCRYQTVTQSWGKPLSHDLLLFWRAFSPASYLRPQITWLQTALCGYLWPNITQPYDLALNKIAKLLLSWSTIKSSQVSPEIPIKLSFRTSATVRTFCLSRLNSRPWYYNTIRALLASQWLPTISGSTFQKRYCLQICPNKVPQHEDQDKRDGTYCKKVKTFQELNRQMYTKDFVKNHRIEHKPMTRSDLEKVFMAEKKTSG